MHVGKVASHAYAWRRSVEVDRVAKCPAQNRVSQKHTRFRHVQICLDFEKVGHFSCDATSHNIFARSSRFLLKKCNLPTATKTKCLKDVQEVDASEPPQSPRLTMNSITTLSSLPKASRWHGSSENCNSYISETPLEHFVAALKAVREDKTLAKQQTNPINILKAYE